MSNIATILMKINATSSRNEKEALLTKYADYPGLKDILNFIYNPYIRTGIARAKLNKAKPTDLAATYIEWEDIMNYLKGNNTGTMADATYAKTFVDQFSEGTDARTVAEGLVTKSLKIGVTAKTLNKVFGKDFIPMIGIMKAKDYEARKDKVKGPFIVTEKLDGARRLIIKENGKIALYSRSGIPDEGLVDIEREAEYLPDNCAYDGELLAIGEFDNAIELRQATNAIANRKGIRTGLTFNVFDMIPLVSYKKGVSDHTCLIRKLMLGGLFGDESIECLAPTNYKEIINTHKLPYDFEYIKSVPIEGIAKTEDDVRQLTEPIWRRGFEGTMLNTFNGKYDITKDRVDDILKVKNVEEHVLKVIGVEEGKAGHKYEGMLGALVVDYKGHDVGVGMGLSDDLRKKWWDNPNLIIGKDIEVECFGESTNKQGGLSLNCPVFKRVVGNE